ncbi:hypothetical protein WR25_17749 [Diploscapter pachys]|uniref:Uncharacterized protein n=1 Tax=Diploscapter pachys TaxID=2018661 RepID=A0A2A2LPH9_9BILA|nr:hypothetical protein WR25_17749 [Diploscapter pachys]
MALLGSCWEILPKQGALMSWNGGSGSKQRRMAFQQRGLKKTGKESVRHLDAVSPRDIGTAIVPAQVRPGPRASHGGSVERLPLGRQPHNSSLPQDHPQKCPPAELEECSHR